MALIKIEEKNGKLILTTGYNHSGLMALAADARKNDEQMWKGKNRLIGEVPQDFIDRGRKEEWLFDDKEFKKQLKKEQDGAFMTTRHAL